MPYLYTATNKAEMQTLQSEIKELKLECWELWAELWAAREATLAAPTPAGNESAQPASFQALKKDVEHLQATVEAQSKSYAAALNTGARNRAQPKKKTRHAW